MHLRNGKYGLIEIKSGGEKLIGEGIATLKSLAGKIDTDRMNAPSFLMVLTGTGRYAYTTEDGIRIVPVGCLKPWPGNSQATDTQEIQENVPYAPGSRNNSVAPAYLQADSDFCNCS